jgi:hypothetical protein
MSVINKTRLTERYSAEFKAEVLNAMNRAQLPGPNTDPRNANFGVSIASTQVNYSRRVQMSAKFVF